MDTGSLESYVRQAWNAFKANYFSFLVAILLLMAVGCLFVLIGLLPLIMVVVSMAASGGSFASSFYAHSGEFLMSLVFAGVFFAFTVMVSFAFHGGMMAMAVEALSKGSTSFRTMISSSRAKWKSFIGVGLLVTVITTALVVLLLAPGLLLVSTVPLYGWMVLLIGILVLIPVVLYLEVLFAFVYLAVLDGRKALPALRASMDFGKKNFWDAFVLLLFLAALAFLAALLNAAIPLLGSLVAYFVVVPLQLLSIAALYTGRKKGAAVKLKRKK